MSRCASWCRDAALAALLLLAMALVTVAALIGLALHATAAACVFGTLRLFHRLVAGAR